MYVVTHVFNPSLISAVIYELYIVRCFYLSSDKVVSYIPSQITAGLITFTLVTVPSRSFSFALSF